MSTAPGITLHNITLHTLGDGRGITLKGHGGSTGLTMLYSEFSDPVPSGHVGMLLEDQSGTFNGTDGFTINIGTPGSMQGSGVAMFNLTSEHLTFVAANLPDSGPGGSGEIWTMTWAAGSTYTSTPVAIYYSSNFGGYSGIIFYILDPADSSYHTNIASGTFKFPAQLVAGTTTTSYTG